MKQYLFAVLMIFLFSPDIHPAACRKIFENRAMQDTLSKKGQNVRIMFYNIENLYDPKDDSLKSDEEFTPGGARHWNYSRFRQKLAHLAKTILAVGEWDPPAVVGMCEAENRYVLERLIHDTPLKKYGYRCIQFDSPDLRGVDAVMIYRPEKFNPLFSRPVRIVFPWDTTIKTRDILYVKGVLFGSDTLHLFVNHWPSRRGGVTESQPRRNYVAGLVRTLADSLFSADPSANVLIMGDFNDEPTCESLHDILKAGGTAAGNRDLVNLMWQFQESGRGTHKFRGHWGILDQFIVSNSLLSDTASLFTTLSDVHIFENEFLMSEDPGFFGSKPLRTYSGPAYVGGFSDHLPIWITLLKRTDDDK